MSPVTLHSRTPLERVLAAFARSQSFLLEARRPLDAAAGAGGASSSSASTSITQIVQHVNPEPASEFEYAERIRNGVAMISDPNLMVTILKVLQTRMADIKKEWQARG